MQCNKITHVSVLFVLVNKRLCLKGSPTYSCIHLPTFISDAFFSPLFFAKAWIAPAERAHHLEQCFAPCPWDASFFFSFFPSFLPSSHLILVCSRGFAAASSSLLFSCYFSGCQWCLEMQVRQGFHKTRTCSSSGDSLQHIPAEPHSLFISCSKFSI